MSASSSLPQRHKYLHYQILSFLSEKSTMEPPYLKLVILQGPREGETLGFAPGKSVRIGRIVRHNTLPIKDAGISSNHLSIEIESGKWIVRDLNSSNGTILNGSKIHPNTPFDLHHGDTLKIGEETSIQVDLQANEDNFFRRNPRRRATEKVGGGCDEKLEEDKNLEAAVQPVGNKRRGRPRTGRVLKSEVGEELNKVVLQSTDEDVKVGNELMNVVSLQEKVELPVNTGRVTRNSKNNKVQLRSTDEDAKVRNELMNVVSLQEKVEPPVNTGRITRNSKKKQEQSVTGTSNSCPVNIPDSSGLKCREEKIVEKKTRVGTRRRRLQEEASQNDQAAVSEDMVQETRDGEADLNAGAKVGFDKDESRNFCCNVAEEGQEACYPQKKDLNENGDWPDLEKLTLGDWFDFLEVHFPKQIIDATEEIIGSMKEKAERVRDYMVRQKNEKVKLPVG